MAQSEGYVYTILNRIRRAALGISDRDGGGLTGFVVSFRPTGLPIEAGDYKNPWRPFGNNGTSTIPTDPATITAIKNAQMALQKTADLCNAKLMLDGSGQAVPSSTSISNTWKIIIGGATAFPPKPVNDPVLAQAIEKAQKLLYVEDPNDPDSADLTPKHQRYRELKRKYNRSIQNYAMGYAAAMATVSGAETWPIVGRSFASDVDDAFSDWTTLGHKEEIEAALDLLAAQGHDPTAQIIAGAKKRLPMAELTLSEMAGLTAPYTVINPTKWYDIEADGWTRYTFDSSTVSAHESQDSTSWGGGLGISVGFWSFGGGSSHSESHQHRDFSSENLSIEFEYTVVDIQRPWLETALFNIGRWFLPGHPKNCISNGMPSQASAPDDETNWLPAIPTQMFLIRKLKIKTDGVNQVWDAMQESTSVNVSFGWGPFHVGGHYDHSSSSSSFNAYRSGEYLCVDGVQLMGWISEVVPQCPKTDEATLAAESGQAVVSAGGTTTGTTTTHG
ncbi:MAG TPA: hypothetical protein VHE55_04620 [Fimbriimonadaceae bacterium]|nr:hypothetical protein [Fimbriimonadaceae bacterium]